MRTLTLTMSSILFSLLMIFTSCSKDAEMLMNTKPVMSYQESKYITDLEAQIAKIELDYRGSVANPFNPINYMDSYGKYTQSMLINVNNAEKLNPSNDSLIYINKFKDYLLNNPIQSVQPVNQINISPLVSALKIFILNNGEVSNVNLVINRIKLIENSIAKTKLLNADEKAYLLTFSSIYKYTIYFIGTTDNIYAYGNNISFDRAFLVIF